MERRMNREIEHRLRRALTEEAPVSEQAVDQLILLAKAQWEPQKKRERTGFLELLLSQLRIIGWKMWMVELTVTFVLAFIIMKLWRLHVVTPVRAVFLLSCLTVMISMFWIPFIYRSSYYQMAEIEAASFFSMKRLLLCRILLLSAGELAAIIGVSTVTSVRMGFRFQSSMSCMLFFFAVYCAGMLFLLRRAEIEKLCCYFLAYGGALMVMLLLLNRFMPHFFDGTFWAWIAAGVFILLGACIYQGFHLVGETGEMPYA